jgi:hypothetical protein
MTERREASAVGERSKTRRRTNEAARTCAHEGCDTILSRYNKTDWCGVHELLRTLLPATRQSG